VRKLRRREAKGLMPKRQLAPLVGFVEKETVTKSLAAVAAGTHGS